jgi:DNA-binding MarR family transcriptional regulator
LDNNQQPIISENHLRWTLFDMVHSAIARARGLEIAKFGLTTEQSKVLHTIYMNGGTVTENDIARATLRQHHSIYSLINRMMKAKLIKKVKSPKEKFARIMATDKGKTIYSQLTRTSTEYIFSALNEEDQKQLDAILAKLKKRSNNLLGLDRDELLQDQAPDEAEDQDSL